MKQLKRITSVILTLCMLVTAPLVFAENDPDYMLGDVDGDKMLTADDARSILRASAGLGPSLPLLQADANNDNRITADDARLILRKSAKLEKLLYGYDENGIPNVLEVLRSGTYSLLTEFMGTSVSLAVNNGAVYMAADDLIDELMGDPGEDFGEILKGNIDMRDICTDIGVLIRDGKVYGFLTIKGLGEKLCFDLSEDDDDLSLLASLLAFPEDETYVRNGTAIINGEDCLVYSAIIGDDYTKNLYLGYNAQLMAISASRESDEVSIIVNYVAEGTGLVSDAVFTDAGTMRVKL